MPTRNQVCAWVAGFGLALPSSALAQDRTEREVVDVIVREGPQARAINAGVDVVRREQLARLAYPNPVFSYSREGAGFSEFVQVEQRLPLLGARGAIARAGAAATEVAEAERDAQLWQLRMDAATLTNRLAAAEARHEAALGYTREVVRLVEILRTREREGEGSRFDRLRAEHELREARLAAAGAGIDAGDARARLASMLPAQYTLDRVIWAPAVRTPAPVEALMVRAVTSRADLRAVDSIASRAELESAAVRRARLPAPTLLGGMKRSDSLTGRERGGVFGVTFAVPLFDAGGRDAARWAAERERAARERFALEQKIRTEVARAADTLARRQAVLTEDTSSAGDDLMAIAEVAYREGEIGILELLDAARSAARARSRSIDVQFDVRLAELALESAVGGVLWP